MAKIHYSNICQMLSDNGYYLDIPESEYKGVTLTPLYCHDDYGYKYVVIHDRIAKGQKPGRFHVSNPFTIENINNYLKINNVHFLCISNKYEGKNQILDFQCTLCGEIIKNSWNNVNRNNLCVNRNHVVCPNCDHRIESLHACVLKQIFLHEYPGTIIEDKSYINPITNKICPTDIVNHNLKIAIEIESQWHDLSSIKLKDKQKKDFWIEKGYSFYDPDIRNFSVLEMCNLFFDIKEIPEYVDMHYSDGINAKQIQKYLNNGYSVAQISKILNVSTHRIYDAKSSGKIYYPKDYQRADWVSVIQYDLQWNKIAEYESIAQAAEANNLCAKNIAAALNRGRSYSSGYNWKRK